MRLGGEDFKDVNSRSQQETLEKMERLGSPYLCASRRQVNVGDTFQICDQMFAVARLCTKQEYFERYRRYPHNIEIATCFFEATTD